jgi:hypothetical protein
MKRSGFGHRQIHEGFVLRKVALGYFFQIPMSFPVSIIPPMPHTRISLFCYQLTNSLTPCSGVLLEKLTGSQLVNKFLAFYGPWRFLTAFTTPPPIRFLIQINLSHAHYPISWSVINLQCHSMKHFCLISTCQYSHVVELLPHIWDSWV